MKAKEYCLLPPLSIITGFAAFAVCCAAKVPQELPYWDYMRLLFAGNWLKLVILPLIFLGIPGTWVADRFRDYPERVRLSPISFGLIAVIPAALLPGCPFPAPLVIGNIVMALTILSMAGFKPGARLGSFKPIAFSKTLWPFAVSLVPLIMLLVYHCKTA